MADFVTLDELKTRLGIVDSSQDATLTAVLAGVVSMVKLYLGYDPTVTSVLDYLDTQGQLKLALKRWPVVSVETVHEDKNGNYGDTLLAFGPETLLVPGFDYSVSTDQGTKAGVLVRLRQVWPAAAFRWPGQIATLQYPCNGCVKVAYTVDNTDVMIVANQAALFEATAQVRAQLTGAGIITSDSMNGAGVSVGMMQRSPNRDAHDNFASPMVAPMLRPYSAMRRLI